jgi:methyl-accepting chemotaxis protein
LLGSTSKGNVGRKSISKKLIVPILAVDLFMGVGATVLWLAGLQILDAGATLLLCVSCYMVSMLAWVLPTLRAMEPLQVWTLRGSTCTAQELLAADRTIEHLPVRVALLHGLIWPLYTGGMFAISYFLLPNIWAYGAPEMAEMTFTVLAQALGPPVVIYPIASFLLEDDQTAIAAELGGHSLEQSRQPAHMEQRLLIAGLSLTLAFVFMLYGAIWVATGETARQVAAVELRETARHDAAHIASGTHVAEPYTMVTRDQLPPLLAAQISQDIGPTVSVVDKGQDRVLAAAAVDDEHWIIAEAPIVYDTRMLWIRLAAVLFITVFGVGVMMLAMARLVIAPLERLQGALRRVTEAGVLSEIGRIPVVRRDEIGELTTEFNHMLDVFDELASAARAVAAGNLQVEMQGPGDLQDSFRAMVARLAELVMQIREAALEVASASAEIHAATYEQERAVGQQSDEIREVSIAIARLAESSTDISKEAGEVLTNAEQTRKRADEVVGEIAELGRHITRVGELLELIRDVADRSDLLALNGSLEATRAGEAGRGFALVATEMRRLAERVTGTVADVRATVAAIGTSNSTTVDATKDSRELAGSTTQAARRIVDVIHIQGTETELVSSAARAIADAVASSAAAITQTRASADGLRERAERLEQLIEQFDVLDRR